MHTYETITDLMPTREMDDFSLHETIVDRVSYICKKYRNLVAVVDSTGHHTFSEIDYRSDLVAKYLVEEYGSSIQPISLLLSHSADYIITILGVIKAGRSFANIDRHAPSGTIDYIIENLGSNLLLYDSVNSDNARSIVSRQTSLKALDVCDLPKTTNCQFEKPRIESSNIAYIIYTSGTTGRPKGVVLTHYNVLSLAETFKQYLHIVPEDKALQVCPLWTAASAAEVFPFILNGGSIYPFSLEHDGLSLLPEFIDSNSITVLTFLPQLFRDLMLQLNRSRIFSYVRLIRVSGDRATKYDLDLFNKHFSTKCLLRVAYACSEAPIITHSYYRLGDQVTTNILPAGRNMAGSSISIVNADKVAVGPGVIGRIVIEGRFISDGYWQDKENTDKHFQFDGIRRRFFSSDLGMIDENGVLHHYGRSTAYATIQKKIYFRDIESTLLSLNDIQNVIIQHAYIEGIDILRLYVFLKNDASNVALRERIEALLSDFTCLKEIVFAASRDSLVWKQSRHQSPY